MGLRSKMCDWVTGWMDGYPLDCYNYKSTCGGKKKKRGKTMNEIGTLDIGLPVLGVSVNPQMGCVT